MATTQYVGARYVPKFAEPYQWNQNSAYEALTIVGNLNASYTSKKPVPAGIDILNTEYWAQTGNYNGQVEQYRQEVEQLQHIVDTNTDDIEELTQVQAQHTTDITGLTSTVNTHTANIVSLQQDMNGVQTKNTQQDAAISDVTNMANVNMGNINSLTAQIATMSSKLPVDPQSNILFVGKKGCQFTTINAAIAAAKEYATELGRVLIFITPGLYEESIRLIPNPGIDFMGASKDTTIIRSNAAYPEAAIHTIGTGSFFNIYFQSTNSYACHVDWQDLPTNHGIIYFDNCRFESSATHGVGVGMGDNTKIYFTNCDIQTKSPLSTSYALYFHNYPGPAQSQYFIIRNCHIENLTSNEREIRVENAYVLYGEGTPGNPESQMFISASNNMCRSPRITYIESTSTSYTYIPTTGNISLFNDSYGNNVIGLNVDTSQVSAQTYTTTNTGGFMQIIIPNAYMYNWSIIQCKDANTQEDLECSNLGSPSGRQTLNLQVANTTEEKLITIALTGVPAV